MNTPAPEAYFPPEPESLEQAGLADSLVEQLVLKILYFRGDLYAQDLSIAIGLRFSVINDVLESLKLRHLIQVKRSLGMGAIGSLLSLTDSGATRAREQLETNQYSGAAPVPLDQYAETVRKQRLRDGWLTRDALARIFRHIVVTERVLSQIGPALSSANSLLIYGKPGDGKTFLIEALARMEAAPIYLPYAIECQGNIVQLYDPVYHHRVVEEPHAQSAISMDTSAYDRRYARCKRPFIVSGGELTLDMLDLRFNSTSRVYEGPFQLKANNGIYLIDDFGRQRTTPVEVLNRWIVPMERRLDYLTFLSGGKMTVPFETLLIFSTNLNPGNLGDEAFLRRIQYKMLLRGPAESEFIRIFENCCAERHLACSRDMIVRFIDRHYRSGKPFRRCHPRDLLKHALNMMHFEKMPIVLTDEVLDHAFESCFVQEHEDGQVTESPILPGAPQTCEEDCLERLERIPTKFGRLAFVANLRDGKTGEYRDVESAQRYGEEETQRALSLLHHRGFAEWLKMPREQQVHDLTMYLSSGEAGLIKLTMDRMELVKRLSPPGAKPEDTDLFSYALSMILDRPATAMAETA